MSLLHPRLVLFNTNESEQDNFRVLCGTIRRKAYNLISIKFDYSFK